jgi:hypothetical protein
MPSLTRSLILDSKEAISKALKKRVKIKKSITKRSSGSKRT